MKKLTYFLTLMFAAMLIITSCSKDETNSNTDPNTDLAIVTGCKLTVYKSNPYSIDSTFYSDNKISKVCCYEYDESLKKFFLQNKLRFEYSGNDINQYSFAMHDGTSWTERLDNKYDFKDSKISQIKGFRKNFQSGEENYNFSNTNYYYTGDKLKYIIMTEEFQLYNSTEYERDSILCSYDSKGFNINEITIYRFNDSQKRYVKFYKESYTFDDKINSLKNHFELLYIDVLDYTPFVYFNQNNILKIIAEDASGTYSREYVYTYNENNMPTLREDSSFGSSPHPEYYLYQCD